MLCIAYVLNNLVKAGCARRLNPISGQAYFTEEKKPWLDTVYVEDLFEHNQALQDFSYCKENH